MKLPKHVAIIMDGNGRWAESRRHSRLFGHIRGARTAKNLVEYCTKINIECLTLFAFSTENWFRPANEVSFLMRLLVRHLNREKENLKRNNIRFRVIGDISRLPESVKLSVNATIEETKNNTGLNLVFALSYGSRQELSRAVQDICVKIKTGQVDPEDVSESMISQSLESSFLPDPDLIIRTSGEHRLSNFLLWQAAYSELYISPKFWPEFSESDFDQALAFYSKRERRFGRLGPSAPRKESLISH